MTKYNQDELYKISQLLWYRVNELLDLFKIEYDYGKKVTMACPCHGGDNPNALSIKDGFWRCFTRNCHDTFMP